MKAERIQTDLPEIPGWHTEALLTAERQLTFPSFLTACRFVAQVAERTETPRGGNTSAGDLPRPQIDIRQEQVTLRVAASDPNFLDAELQLIDELSHLVGTLDGDSSGGVTSESGNAALDPTE